MNQNNKMKKDKSKQAQGKNQRFSHSRSAQEEMVGFALIIVLVSIILLVFLYFTIKQPQEEIRSYEASNFLQAFLQYTTDCKDSSGNYYSIQSLIFDCEQNKTCLDKTNNESKTCDILNQTLDEIVKKSFNTGPNNPYKGYTLHIITEENIIFSSSSGNITETYKFGFQEFYKRNKNYNITFNIYS